MVQHLAHRVKIHHPDLLSVKFYQLHKEKPISYLPQVGERSQQPPLLLQAVVAVQWELAF
jgi:hypothetical protein